jgi:septum formation inhibitor MinC
VSTKPGTKGNAEAQLVVESVAATQVNIKTAKKAQQEQSTSTGEVQERERER